MKAKEIRSTSEDRVNEILFETLREQFNLKIQYATRQLSGGSQLKKVRRQIARIKTILHERVRPKDE